MRTPIKASLRLAVLTESGYRCAVPTCRNILALDMHHIVEVNEGGLNEQSNLVALCPTCHALYTRGTISRDSINAWKTMLVSLSNAFDQQTISNLLFLHTIEKGIRKRIIGIMNEDIGVSAETSIRLIRPSEPGFSQDVLMMNLLLISGDGVLKFSHLIASDLAEYVVVPQNERSPLYFVSLTSKGERIIEAWFSGNREQVRLALSDIPLTDTEIHQ